MILFFFKFVLTSKRCLLRQNFATLEEQFFYRLPFMESFSVSCLLLFGAWLFLQCRLCVFRHYDLYWKRKKLLFYSFSIPFFLWFYESFYFQNVFLLFELRPEIFYYFTIVCFFMVCSGRVGGNGANCMRFKWLIYLFI